MDGFLSVAHCVLMCDKSMFHYDFAAGYASTNTNIIERKLQQTINKLENWANNNGFRFSIDKTYIVHVCDKRNLHPDPQLTLYNHPIPVTSEFKFLGVVFDNKVSFYLILTTLKLKP